MFLKEILGICDPDWIETEKGIINVRKNGIPDYIMKATVKNITGFDDGLTVEVLVGSTPCTHLSTKRRCKE